MGQGLFFFKGANCGTMALIERWPRCGENKFTTSGNLFEVVDVACMLKTCSYKINGGIATVVPC